MTIKTEVKIPTPDGVCRAYTFAPDAKGPWPAAIILMDAYGMRPALFEMGHRLAKAGYFVLLPDLYYRVGTYDPVHAKTVSSDTVLRENWFDKYFASANQANVLRDTPSLLSFLEKQPDVDAKKVGVTGYCMGGALALAIAGHFPTHIGAVASYHGGRLATDAADSPHLLASKIQAEVYIGAAIEDPSFSYDMKQRLEDAFKNANLHYSIETYPGCYHGWVPADTLKHNEGGAERHWQTLISLFDRVLKRRTI